jgi:tetratricopeptide (TPR) repeat protein
MKPALILLIAFSVMASGCATSPAPGSDSGAADEISTAPPETPASGQPAETVPAPRPSRDQATLALLNQSERAAASGEIDEAISYAERAVRIDPRRADLWTGLARLELANEDPDTAIRYAQKALSLAGSRADWQRDAWLVIADAKDALGESAEAAEIRASWKTVRG